MALSPTISSIRLSARLLAPLLLLTTALFCTSSSSATNQDPNRPIKDKWALVIGVSKFADPKIPTLKYPSKDAADFCNFLVKQGNFAPDHVLLLTNENATREKILDAFGDGWLPRRVMEDDLVLIFISSHGSPADRAGENFIIAYDSNPNRPYSTSIRLQDLAAELTKRTSCDRLVLLLDACHSGAAVEGEKGLQRANSNFDLDAITGSGQLVISSSKPDQVSWESKRYPNGVFTHNLINALQLRGRQTRIDEAYKALKDGVEMEVRLDRIASQTPLMLNKWSGNELALCAPPAEPRVISFLDQEETPAVSSNKNQSAKPEVPAKNQALATIPASLPPKQNAALPERSFPSPPANNMGSNPPSAQDRALVSPAMMAGTWTNNLGDPTLERGTRLLKEAELKPLNKEQIMRLLNEIYARHGRGFLTRGLQTYFNGQSWYKQDPDYHWRADDPVVVTQRGIPDDPKIINEKRTPLQWANLQLLKKAMQSR